MVGGQTDPTIWIATWNVGGLTADKVLEVLESFGGHAELQALHILMLQEIITEPGLFHAESDNWQLVYGKQSKELRGEGIAHTTAYSHHNSTVSKAAVHTQIRSKQGTSALRATSGHIPHHATIP